MQEERQKETEEGEKKRGVFLLHFTGSQFDFELEADTHYGRAISESPSPHGCSLLLRSLCTGVGVVPGGPH